jgi:hypothetical protein
MSTHPPRSEQRQKLAARIEQIPSMIDGTLTERPRQRGSGSVRVYHQLQRWRGGRNDTRHVPAECVEAVREGIAGYRQAQALLQAIAQVDEAALLSHPSSDSKKKPTKR